MRQTHMGGEKIFVDFAGDTIDIFDPITGEAHAMKLFVAATLDGTLRDLFDEWYPGCAANDDNPSVHADAA